MPTRRLVLPTKRPTLPAWRPQSKELGGREVASVDADAAHVALEVVLRVPHPRALRANDEVRLPLVVGDRQGVDFALKSAVDVQAKLPEVVRDLYLGPPARLKLRLRDDFTVDERALARRVSPPR